MKKLLYLVAAALVAMLILVPSAFAQGTVLQTRTRSCSETRKNPARQAKDTVVSPGFGMWPGGRTGGCRP